MNEISELKVILKQQLNWHKSRLYLYDYSQKKSMRFNCQDLINNKEQILNEGQKQDRDFFYNDFKLIKTNRPQLPTLLNLNTNQQEYTNKNCNGYENGGYDSKLYLSNHDRNRSRFYGKLKKKPTDTVLPTMELNFNS